MIIPLAPPLPVGSSNLPESSDGPPSNALLFGLAPGGACLAPDVATGLVSSYLTVSPLPRHRRSGLLSVALACSSPRLGLPSTLPCGARTFLQPRLWRNQRSSALLQILLVQLHKKGVQRYIRHAGESRHPFRLSGFRRTPE